MVFSFTGDKEVIMRGNITEGKNRRKNEVRGFIPGKDNDEIVRTIVAITEKGVSHAKVKRKKDGSLSISAVSEKQVS